MSGRGAGGAGDGGLAGRRHRRWTSMSTGRHQRRRVNRRSDDNDSWMRTGSGRRGGGGRRARLDEDWEAGELEDEDERGVAAGAPCTTSNTGSTPPPTRKQYHVGGASALQCAGTAPRTVCVGSCWGAAPSLSYLLFADYVDINATYASAHTFRYIYIQIHLEYTTGEIRSNCKAMVGA